jgi:hypothetical protein
MSISLPSDAVNRFDLLYKKAALLGLRLLQQPILKRDRNH